MRVLSALVKEGKIRYIGLSNETPWGTMKCLQLAQQHGLERIISVQNPYNLLNRVVEVGLARCCCANRWGCWPTRHWRLVC